MLPMAKKLLALLSARLLIGDSSSPLFPSEERWFEKKLIGKVNPPSGPPPVGDKSAAAAGAGDACVTTALAFAAAVVGGS